MRTAAKASALTAVKLVHTVVWAFFVVCILAIPLVAWREEFRAAGWLAAIVAVEVAVLLANRMRCPLSDLASRYTGNKQDNFDIYLPNWLARHNKLIFGAVYLGGSLFALLLWLSA